MLDLYVIYERPQDYPDCYVLRRHSVTSAGALKVSAHAVTIEASIGRDAALQWLRGFIPVGLVSTSDPNPVIVEVWF